MPSGPQTFTKESYLFCFSSARGYQMIWLEALQHTQFSNESKEALDLYTKVFCDHS